MNDFQVGGICGIVFGVFGTLALIWAYKFCQSLQWFVNSGGSE